MSLDILALPTPSLTELPFWCRGVMERQEARKQTFKTRMSNRDEMQRQDIETAGMTGASLDRVISSQWP